MALIIDKVAHSIVGVDSFDFTQSPRFALRGAGNVARRPGPATAIVIHTTLGLWPQTLVGQQHPRTKWVENVMTRWSNDDRAAGAHIAIDYDGRFVCGADLARSRTSHAGQVNDHTVGIEVRQSRKGEIRQASVDTCVRILDVITRELGIQRQFATERQICVRFAAAKPERVRRGGKLVKNPAFMPGGLAGSDFVGVYGHRNTTRNRGQGDPGDIVFDALRDAGYEAFSVNEHQDIQVWRSRQDALGVDASGIPGAETVRALAERSQTPLGLWVPRPGD